MRLHTPPSPCLTWWPSHTHTHLYLPCPTYPPHTIPTLHTYLFPPPFLSLIKARDVLLASSTKKCTKKKIYRALHTKTLPLHAFHTHILAKENPSYSQVRYTATLHNGSKAILTLAWCPKGPKFLRSLHVNLAERESSLLTRIF